MCGIAGVLHLGHQPVDAQLVRRMVATIRHRGPDAGGVHVAGPIGLGHARLSIIDLSGGRQPMTNEDRSLWVTFNGEIFNYVELRETLQQRGHRFATRSDTEVILHAYEEYGDRCVEHFNGQWAFVLWDARRERLLASRDRLGIRPLYYTTAGNKFLFASEVKALAADEDVALRLDPAGLDQVFTFWCPIPPRTVFRDICELPPAHNLVVHEGRLSMRRYWQLDFGRQPDTIGGEEAAERLLDLLTDATRIRLRADVPVGAYLSGGLDSSVTTALIQRTSTAPLRTFSITFDDPEFDESAYQQEVVRTLQTDHLALRCSWEDIGRELPEVIWHAERPVLRTAPVPLMLLAQLVRDAGYKVVMTGEGADELLGGYDIFKEAKLRRFWAAQPDSPRRTDLLGRLYPYLPNLRAQSAAYRQAFFRVHPEDLSCPWFSHLPRWDLTARLKMFFSEDLRAELAGYDAYDDLRAQLPDGFAAWKPFCQAQWLESSLLLPGYILSSQGDRVAMANSIEGRFPFLDYRVAEFAATLPPRLKMMGLTEKYLLKRAARGIVPPSVLQRSKQPYRAPDAKSLFGDGRRAVRHEYVERLL